MEALPVLLRPWHDSLCERSHLTAVLSTVVPHFQPVAFTLSFLQAKPVKAHSAKPYSLKDTEGSSEMA